MESRRGSIFASRTFAGRCSESSRWPELTSSFEYAFWREKKKMSTVRTGKGEGVRPMKVVHHPATAMTSVRRKSGCPNLRNQQYRSVRARHFLSGRRRTLGEHPVHHREPLRRRQTKRQRTTVDVASTFEFASTQK